MMWKLIVPVVFVALCTVGSAGLVGAPVDVELTDDEYARNALKFAVVEYNRQSNDAYFAKPAEVLSVQKQVVAGYLYTITVRMGKTSCRKNDASDLCTINDNPEAKPYQCVFKVWTRPWINETTLRNQNC